MKTLFTLCLCLLVLVSEAQNFNPNNAYVDTVAPGLGCIVCDQYAVGDSFSLDNGGSWYTVVNRSLLIQKRDSGGDLSKVCVSHIVDMNKMFHYKFVNPDIGNWDVSNVTNMRNMFFNAVFFNSDIGNWDVSNVTDMSGMFAWADDFNQDIGNWDVSRVTDLNGIFYESTAFNHDLSAWCVRQFAGQPPYFADYSPIATNPAFHPVWGTCPSCPNYSEIAQVISNYRVHLSWNSRVAATYNVWYRTVGDSTWSKVDAPTAFKNLFPIAPGNYEFYISEAGNVNPSCIGNFTINCATDITYTFNAFQAPEIGRLGRLRVFGIQGGKSLYDIHLIDQFGDSSSVFNVRQKNFTNLADGFYMITVQDEFGCSADSIGVVVIEPMDTMWIPNLINAPNNPPNGFRPTWNSVDGVINYQLRVLNVTDGTLQDFVSGIIDTNYAVTNLPAGKLYRFNVRSRYNNGAANVVSGYSNAVSRNLLAGGNKGEESSTGETLADGMKLLAYPNPTKDLLYVQAPEGSTLTLIDMNGKAIAHRPSKGTEEIMDLTELAQGVYLLEVKNQGQLYHERIVKQ